MNVLIVMAFKKAEESEEREGGRERDEKKTKRTKPTFADSEMSFQSSSGNWTRLDTICACIDKELASSENGLYPARLGLTVVSTFCVFCIKLKNLYNVELKYDISSFIVTYRIYAITPTDLSNKIWALLNTIMIF
jgi:hypothetical protein